MIMNYIALLLGLAAARVYVCAHGAVFCLERCVRAQRVKGLFVLIALDGNDAGTTTPSCAETIGCVERFYEELVESIDGDNRGGNFGKSVFGSTFV